MLRGSTQPCLSRNSNTNQLPADDVCRRCEALLLSCRVCCLYRLWQDFHSRSESVNQAHADVQQLLDTAGSHAFINAAPGAEETVEQQFNNSREPW